MNSMEQSDRMVGSETLTPYEEPSVVTYSEEQVRQMLPPARTAPGGPPRIMVQS